MNAQCISVCKVASTGQCTSASLTQCSCLNATVAFRLTYHNIYRLGPNQHQQCMAVLPAAADAPTQVSSTLTSCCLQMMHLSKLPPVCERSHCTTRRCHMLELLASNACREGAAMSNDVHIARRASS